MTTKLSKEANVFMVSIAGRFTSDAAASFLKEIDPVIQESGCDVVMDLADLEFISSAGLRCFVVLLKACQANGSTLRIRNLTPQIRDIFTLTALIDKFVVE